ncbi:MAG: cysteine synthase family protein [Selenomonadaceae bacterium]|nr:cysteine synthase family protein [Selenomonadaceae bacterium]MBR1859621.1 cysteine synthase family protein [Selenomonadaceae bacterium]
MNIFEAVGNTPLFELQNVYKSERGIKIFGKAEFLNPSGSVKDRAAKFMLQDGIKKGCLKSGMEILDATSGSTGISYCMMASAIGCKVTLCMPANVSQNRKKIIRAYGGHIIETSPLEGPEGAFDVAQNLIHDNPDKYFYPDQYNNSQNWLSHYNTTAPEIWQQTLGKITHFVSGTGTSGTFVGTVKKLKTLNNKISAVLMQPDSPFHGLEGLRHISTARHKGFFDESLADIEIPVETEIAYEMVRRLAREEGLLVGISAAANVIASIKLAKSAPDNSVIVTILCDNGIRYLDEPVWNI